MQKNNTNIILLMSTLLFHLINTNILFHKIIQIYLFHLISYNWFFILNCLAYDGGAATIQLAHLLLAYLQLMSTLLWSKYLVHMEDIGLEWALQYHSLRVAFHKLLRHQQGHLLHNMQLTKNECRGRRRNSYSWLRWYADWPLTSSYPNLILVHFHSVLILIMTIMLVI